MKTTSLTRRTPLKKKRAKARPGRLQGGALKLLRELVFKRDGGKCVDCGVELIEYPPSIFHQRAYHMAHVRNKRMWMDSVDNCVSKCSGCHLVKEHTYGKSGQKPCPSRQRRQHERISDYFNNSE